MKRSAITCLTLLLAGFSVVSAVQAEAFVNPPEENHPQWVTPFPYQRNIWIEFDTDPHEWPDHISSPTPDDSKRMSPLEVHHEGTDDAKLYPSDWLGGDVQPNDAGFTEWLENDTVTDSGRTGILKLEATAGTEEDPTEFELVWHIDNWDRPFEEKHFFAEAVYWSNVDGALNTDSIFSVDDSYLLDTNAVYEELSDGWTRWYSWGTLVPNPEYEEMVNTIIFTEPGILLMDSMHIATECVPEPGTLTLLTFALITLGLVAWRRRR